MMGTVIEKLERKAMKHGGTLHHKKALFAGLGGEPEKYDYTGKVVDAGPGSSAKCACGHPIRFVFFIKHRETGQQRHVGSTCINHFAGVNAALLDSLQGAYNKLTKELQEREREARKAAEAVRTSHHAKRYTKLYRLAYNFYMYTFVQSRIHAPYKLYKWFNGYGDYVLFPKCPKKYARQSSYTTWYKQESKRIIAGIRECTEFARERAMYESFVQKFNEWDFRVVQVTNTHKSSGGVVLKAGNYHDVVLPKNREDFCFIVNRAWYGIIMESENFQIVSKN